jgi:hypothetical protein
MSVKIYLPRYSREAGRRMYRGLKRKQFDHGRRERRPGSKRSRWNYRCGTVFRPDFNHLATEYRNAGQRPQRALPRYAAETAVNAEAA